MNIIPAVRLPTSDARPWRPLVGVPGGTNPVRTLIGDFGGDRTGATDVTADLVNMSGYTGQNGILNLLAGDYYFNSGAIVMGRIDDMTIRGTLGSDGKPISVFQFGINCGGIEFGGDQSPLTPVLITGGLTKGSTEITVTSASQIVIGAPLRIHPIGHTFVHNKQGSHPNTAGHWVSSMHKVTNKIGNQVFITPGLPYDVSAYETFLYPFPTPYMKGFGFENIKIDMTNSNAVKGIQFLHSWGCWLKNVEIVGSDHHQMIMDDFCAGEIRHCYVHGTRSSGPQHEGIDFRKDDCWNLVEDNVLDAGGKPQIIFGDAFGGHMGNVVAFNSMQGALTSVDGQSDWDLSFNHGPHNMFNLAEGNVLSTYRSDGYYGSDSHNTLFRNWIMGKQSNPAALSNIVAIAFHQGSNYETVIGNVLGHPAFAMAYTSETPSYDGVSNSHPVIYQLGYPYQHTGHNGTAPGTPSSPPDYSTWPNDPQTSELMSDVTNINSKLDLNPKSTVIRHRNYVYTATLGNGSSGPGIEMEADDSNIEDHTETLLDDSLFTTEEDLIERGLVLGDLNFPFISPDDPAEATNPAYERWLAGTPMLDPTGDPPASPARIILRLA